MPDLGKTQAEWTRFAGREQGALQLSPIRLLQETRDRFRLSREQLVVQLDTASFLDASEGATLIGAIPGVNCEPDGTLYVRLTGSGAPRTINVYSAVGGGGLVASGTGNDGTTVTLAEANDSGISGTWRLPGTAANTSADELTVKAFVDYRQMIDRIYDGTLQDDLDSRQVLKDLFDQVGTNIDNAKEQFKAGLNQLLLTNPPQNPIAGGNEFLQSNKSALQTDTAVSDGSGNITRRRDGLYERQRAAMADETTGGEQTVIERVLSAAAAVFSGDNDGQGSLASHTPGEACPASRWVFRCVRGADTGDLGQETFDGEVFFTEEGQEATVTVTGLQIGKVWNGPFQFGPVSLLRTLTKTNDGSDLNLEPSANASVSGENNANTNDGILYWQIEDESGNWNISFYSAASLDASTLVAKATNIPTATGFTATEQNSSGLTVVWGVGSAPIDTTSGVLNLNPFRTSNAAQQTQDEFEIVVSLTSEGLYQRILAEEFSAVWNSATAGAETIPDGFIKQSTFVDFAVQDN